MGVFNHDSVNDVAFEKFLQSLQPKPIAVEVEVETFNFPEDGHLAVHKQIRPEVDENNFVQVVKWVYDSRT